MIILGVGHKSNQGKDAFCQFLLTYLRQQTRGLRIVKAGFADQLKQIFYQLYSWTGIKTPGEYESNRKLRTEIIPYFGTDIVAQWIDFGNHLRKYDGPVWINALMKGSGADVLILSDVRFPNEAKAVLDHKGILLKIDRPGFEGRDSVSDKALDDFTDWTGTVLNDGNLTILMKTAEQFGLDIIKRLEGKHG